MNRVTLVVSTALVALVALFLGLSYKNALVVSAVSIHIKDGVREHRDPVVLGLGAKHQLPDYKIKLHVARRLLDIDLGTKLDTSATNWLEFDVHESVPFRHLQEVIVIEVDKVKNDLLERVQVAGTEIEGASFHYRISTTRSFDAGMAWFFGTYPGKAVFVGITAGVVFLLLGLSRQLFGTESPTGKRQATGQK